MDIARLVNLDQDTKAIATTPTSISSPSASRPTGAPSSTSSEGNPQMHPSPFSTESIETAFANTTSCIRQIIQTRAGIYLETSSLEQWIQDAVHKYLWTEFHQALNTTSEWYSETQDWVLLDEGNCNILIRQRSPTADEASQWGVLRGRKISKQVVIQTAEYLAKQSCDAVAIKIATQCNQAINRVREKGDHACRKLQEELDHARDFSRQLQEQKAKLHNTYHRAILASRKEYMNPENIYRPPVIEGPPCPGCGREDVPPAQLNNGPSIRDATS